MTSRPSTSVSFIRGLTFCFVFMSSIFLTCFMCAQAAPRTSLNFSRLHVFKSEEGVSLKGVVSNGDGWLFGTAAYGGSNNSGTFFKMREDGRDFKVLHSFGVAKSKKPGESSFANQFNDDGMRPIGCLVQGSNEFLYGLTSEGGSYNNGTLYRVRKDGSRF